MNNFTSHSGVHFDLCLQISAILQLKNDLSIFSLIHLKHFFLKAQKIISQTVY